MGNKFILFPLIAAIAVVAGSPVPADVPAPPVNQTLGMRDVWFISLTEAGCRACHSGGVPTRHHVLYGKPIPPGVVVPYPDANGDGIADGIYSCISCHSKTFALVRNCVTCHKDTSPHHAPGGTAWSGECKSCHGSLVDNMNDGHYIPTYTPSLVTPTPTRGDGLPLNTRGNGAGGCDYCHDSDGLATPIIRFNLDLHHGTGLLYGYNHCDWCHDFTAPREAKIRRCENCHGPVSLHNIQADSPAPENIGTIVVGAELAGYGHIGRDMGPGDSDCWGCHGFAMSDAPDSGPVIPTLSRSNKTTFTAGVATSVVLSGAALTNTAGTGTVYESTVTLTAADGTVVTLTPDVIVDQGSLAVTIPATTRPGNYALRAKKANFSSNPVVLTAVPKVWITKAAIKLQTVTITGGGFGGFQVGSGLYVNGTTSTGATVKGTIVSWGTGKIVARFGVAPKKVNVRGIFGTASHGVVSQ